MKREVKRIKGQYRQGDVLVQEIDAVPANAKAVSKAGKSRIILAEGEATGHHHSLDIDAADWWKDADSSEQFVALKKKSGVKHQEHGTIELRKKAHRVVRQRTWNPLKMARRVAD